MTYETRRELTLDTVQALGYFETARLYKKRRYSFEMTYMLIFGKLPRK